MTILNPTSEHSPLSAWDEYPIHQTVQPIRLVDTTDARAYERYWFTAHDKGGEFLLVMGVGFYPNLGTAEAYALLTQSSTHTSVRAHRTLNEDRGEISVGPIRAEMLKPFEEWHILVGANPQDLELDIHWFDTKRAVYHCLNRSTLSGRLPTTTAGYETFGDVEGTIRIKDKTFTLDRARTQGSRDHHWGIRNGVGGPGHAEHMERETYVGQWVEFKDYALWFNRVLFNKGAARQGAQQIVKQDRKLRFDPATKHFIGGVVTNVLDDGTVKEVHYEQIEDRVAYLRFGMYMGADKLGEPDADLYQGSYVGENVVGGSSHSLKDPAMRIRIGGFENHLVRATCDGETVVGVVEVKNPVAYEHCRDGLPGFAFAD